MSVCIQFICHLGSSIGIEKNKAQKEKDRDLSFRVQHLSVKGSSASGNWFVHANDMLICWNVERFTALCCAAFNEGAGRALNDDQLFRAPYWTVCTDCTREKERERAKAFFHFMFIKHASTWRAPHYIMRIYIEVVFFYLFIWSSRQESPGK